MSSCLKAIPKVVIFDFDGVILDSARLKTHAFARAYEGESPEKIDQVIEYQERHGGIGRREKFEYFEKNLFNRTGDSRSVDRLCDKFAALIDEAMLKAPFIKGAKETLELLDGRIPMHLVSGMPEEDVLRVLARRSLKAYFVSVAGSPKKKYDEFVRILQSANCKPEEALAVGDSRTEFDAAVKLGIPFLAIVADGAPDHFPEDVIRRKDLSRFAEVAGVKL